MNTPTLETLTAQFTNLIGADVIAKAEAAIAEAQAAAAKIMSAAAAKTAAATVAAPPKPPLVVPPSGGNATVPPKGGTTNTATATPKTAPAPVIPPAPPIPVSPLQIAPHALRGYHFDALVAPQQVAAAATILDYDGFALDAITGVDWIAQGEMEIVYDYFHPLTGLRVVVRTRVPRANSELPTIADVFPGANWHERETHDFFGIRFTGHPNLKPFLLPEDANFHPLRKDYAP